MSVKKNPMYVSKVNDKSPTVPQKPKLPFGLDILVKQVIYEVNKGAIPSIVLGNALVVAKSSVFPKELTLPYSQPNELPEADRRKVIVMLEKIKQPGINVKEYLTEEFSSVWIKKIKPKDAVVEQKKPIKHKFNKKPMVKKEEKEPVVIIKKSKI